MIQKIILLLLSSSYLFAYNLSEILQSNQNSNSVKVLHERLEADKTDAEFLTSYEAPSLNLSGAHAKDSAEDGLEYGVSFSQTLDKPFAASQKQSASRYLQKALAQKQEHSLHIMSVDIVAKYHSACVSKEINLLAQTLFQEQDTRVAKLQKAYNLGEISKQNLLFHKLDLLKLQQKVNFYKGDSLQKLSQLNENVDTLEITSIACDDLFEIRKDIALTDIAEHAEILEMESLINANRALLRMHETTLSSLGYELMYQKELDTTRYTLGLSIPLDFASSESALYKQKYLAQTSASLSQKEAMHKQIQAQSNSLLVKVETLFDEYILYKEEMVPLSYELKELSKLAQESGEGSLMQHLDSARSYTQNILEMMEIKEKYFQELFELYKTSDKSIGENHANHN